MHHPSEQSKRESTTINKFAIISTFTKPRDNNKSSGHPMISFFITSVDASSYYIHVRLLSKTVYACMQAWTQRKCVGMVFRESVHAFRQVINIFYVEHASAVAE